MPQDSQPAAAPAPDLPLSQPPTPPGLTELFVAFAKMSLAGFGGVLVWARRGIVEQHRWMTADEFNETFALCHFLPGPNIVNLSMVSARGSGGSPAASRPLPAWLSPRRDRDHSGDSLCSFRSGRSAAARSGRRVLCGGRPSDLGRFQDDDAAAHAARSGRARGHGRGVRRDWAGAVAPAGGAIGRDSVQPRRHHCRAQARCSMSQDGHPILTLAWTFGVMSLFAVGGANSAIPEMHRVAVDVHHWLTDKQFADVFAIAQMSPGP